MLTEKLIALSKWPEIRKKALFLKYPKLLRKLKSELISTLKFFNKQFKTRKKPE